jgi:hypothetical protein
VEVELTMLVVIDTDCIGSCKSNYHMITTTMAPVVGFDSHFLQKFCCFRICCVVLPSILSRPCWILCYIFRDLDVSRFLPLIFVFIQHLNHYVVDLLEFCHRCLS